MLKQLVIFYSALLLKVKKPSNLEQNSCKNEQICHGWTVLPGRPACYVLCVCFSPFHPHPLVHVCLQKLALLGDQRLGGLQPGSTSVLKPAQQSVLDCYTKSGSNSESVKVVLCQQGSLLTSCVFFNSLRRSGQFGRRSTITG